MKSAMNSCRPCLVWHAKYAEVTHKLFFYPTHMKLFCWGNDPLIQQRRELPSIIEGYYFTELTGIHACCNVRKKINRRNIKTQINYINLIWDRRPKTAHEWTAFIPQKRSWDYVTGRFGSKIFEEFLQPKWALLFATNLLINYGKSWVVKTLYS